MKTLLPTASRKRLEELLGYLGNTENYSKYYKGNRADDFKKCFDIESPWCWKYADIVLRGLEKRTVKPGDEGHHAVPRAFYGVKHNSRKIDEGNWFILSYAEHVWAHYCALHCATGDTQGKMVTAFIFMYNMGRTRKIQTIPSEKKLFEAIPELEIKRIASMEPRYAKVESEGRTHRTEDPTKYMRDWREVNQDWQFEKRKAYRDKNREYIRNWKKNHYKANKSIISQRHKEYRDAHAEECKIRHHKYYESHKDELAIKNKDYREKHKTEYAEYKKVWSEKNKEKLRIYHHEKYEAEKDVILQKQREHYHNNKELYSDRAKKYYANNREARCAKVREYRQKKRAAGYSERRDPITRKKHWVFVGLPATPETPKSTSGAA